MDKKTTETKQVWFKKASDGMLELDAVATPISSLDKLPINGEPNDCFYLEKEHRFVKWDEKKQDWRIFTLNQVEDQHNDRRGAIKAQKEKRAQG